MGSTAKVGIVWCGVGRGSPCCEVPKCDMRVRLLYEEDDEKEKEAEGVDTSFSLHVSKAYKVYRWA